MDRVRSALRARVLVVPMALLALLAVTSPASGAPPEARLWCTRDVPCTPGSGGEGWCLYGSQVLRCR